MEKRCLTKEDIMRDYSIARSTLYNWIATQGFPKPRKFGSLSRWNAQEVRDWESQRPYSNQPMPALTAGASQTSRI